MLKKLSVLFLTSVLVAGLYFPISTLATTISVVIDGQAQSYDVDPVIVEGRVLMPLRGVFQALGAEVEWDEKEKQIHVTYKRRTLDLTIGSKEMLINNKGIVPIDVGPQIVNNRTMVPLRVVSEWADAEVEWDHRNKTVKITPIETLGYSSLYLNNDGYYQIDLHEFDNEKVVDSFADFVISKGYPMEKEELIQLIHDRGYAYEDNYRFYECIPPLSSYTWIRLEWK